MVYSPLVINLWRVPWVSDEYPSLFWVVFRLRVSPDAALFPVLPPGEDVLIESGPEKWNNCVTGEAFTEVTMGFKILSDLG